MRRKSTNGRRAISPQPARTSVPMSVRLPEDLFGQITAYAEELDSDRSYVVVECLRRALASDPGAPAPRSRRAPQRSSRGARSARSRARARETAPRERR